MAADDPFSFSQIFSLTDLISAPLVATIQADFFAAERFIEYLRRYGFEPPPEAHATEFGKLRMITFRYWNQDRWTEVQIALISLMTLSLLQISEANFHYHVDILGAVSPDRHSLSRDPSQWRLSGTSIQSINPQSLVGSFAPLRSQAANGDSTPTLVANIDVAIKIHQADVPAGIASLLNIAMTSVESQGQKLLTMEPVTAMLSPKQGEALFTARALTRTGSGTAQHAIFIDIQSEKDLSFLSAPEVTSGTLINRPSDFSLNVLTDHDGYAGIKVASKVSASERLDAYITAESEFNMGGGQFGPQRATSLLQVFPTGMTNKHL